MVVANTATTGLVTQVRKVIFAALLAFLIRRLSPRGVEEAGVTCLRDIVPEIRSIPVLIGFKGILTEAEQLQLFLTGLRVLGFRAVCVLFPMKSPYQCGSILTSDNS